MPSQPILYLIDGSAYIYRAFFALPASFRTAAGLPTNAVYGFTTMLLKILREKKPDYVAVAFDPKGPTKRSVVYAEYKSHRPAMPDDLVLQIPWIHRVVEAFRIPVLLEAGVEADDLIGTYARMASENRWEVVVVTGDKDMLQLVSPQVIVYDPMKDKRIGVAEVEARFGVGPNKVIEVMGLMGDASDNIPGVPGIGEKTAIKLIREHGTIEALLEALPGMKTSKIKEKLAAHTEDARMSRELARIDLHVPPTVALSGLKSEAPDTGRLREIFSELEFGSLLKLLGKKPGPATAFSRLDDPEALDRFIKSVRESGELVLSPSVGEISGSPPLLLGLAMGNGDPAAPAAYLAKACNFFKEIFSLLEDPSIRKSGHDLKNSIF